MLGRIDALLNIAGAVPQVELLEMTDAQWGRGLALKEDVEELAALRAKAVAADSIDALRDALRAG